jgi:hypothetical protein
MIRLKKVDNKDGLIYIQIQHITLTHVQLIQFHVFSNNVEIHRSVVRPCKSDIFKQLVKCLKDDTCVLLNINNPNYSEILKYIIKNDIKYYNVVFYKTKKGFE